MSVDHGPLSKEYQICVCYQLLRRGYQQLRLRQPRLTDDKLANPPGRTHVRASPTAADGILVDF